MNIIDRYLLRQFLQNFVICFMSLTGVYVVFDAFTNLEAFMSLAKGLALMKIMAAYYGYQSLFFFDRISALLVLMSAMFTMAWIQRHHEMTALMAAGISRIRVVAPVLVAAVAIILLAVINREVVIPKLKDQLAKRPSDLKGNVVEELLPQYDNATDVLIGGRQRGCRREADRVPVFVVPPYKPSLCEYGKQWSAASAHYLPAKDGRPTGYLLDGRYRAEEPGATSVAGAGRPARADDAPRSSRLAQAQRGLRGQRRDGRRVDRRHGPAAVCLDRRVDPGLEEPQHLFQPRRAGDDPLADLAAAAGHHAACFSACRWWRPATIATCSWRSACAWAWWPCSSSWRSPASSWARIA